MIRVHLSYYLDHRRVRILLVSPHTIPVNICMKEYAVTIFSSLVISSSVSYDDMPDLLRALLFRIFHSPVSIVVTSSSSYSLCHRPGFCPRPTIRTRARLSPIIRR